MTDSPGAPSVLGIEAVEWFSEGGETLTVRVTGRWRRRRPAWSGQPTLVIEALGRRHRFPAMPEPPSLTGAGPGTWRISFAVPVALAPDLGARTWLQFGSVVVALPAAAEPLGAGEGERGSTGVDQSPLEPVDEGAHPASSELEAESARRRAKEAEAAAAELSERVQTIEHALSAARRQAEELTAALAARERERRTAEQRAHAEQALRRDLARQLTARSDQSERARQALGDLAAAEERIRGLEAELADARRRGDEAEQVAAAAAVARERAEARIAEAEGRAADAEERATGVEQRADRTERERSAAPPVSGPGPPELARLQFERGLIGRRATAERRVPSEPRPPSVAADAPSVAPAPGPPAAAPAAAEPTAPAAAEPTAPAAAAPTTPEPAAAGFGPLIAALRRELEIRAGAESALRARTIEAESRLAARVLLERRTATTLVQLRQELDGLRSAWGHERAARTEAEQRAQELTREADEGRRRSQQAHDAIAELRCILLATATEATEEAASGEGAQGTAGAPDGERAEGVEQAAGGEGETAEPPPTAEAQAEAAPPPVEPERFNVARVRLRETIAPHDPDAAPGVAAVAAPVATVKPWLEPIFRALARSDADGAGRLLLELLPAQRAADPEPVAYDLVLGGHRGCIRVTVKDGPPVIRHADGPRSSGEVDFRVIGDPAAVARLLTAGPFRRRFGRGVARVRGRRDRLSALRALVGVRLDLADLYRTGVRLKPELTLTIVARMIEPAWTARERFTLAYAGEAGTLYLLVRDGRPVEVSDEAPGERVSTTITGPAEALGLALSGERSEPVTVTGEDWPLALMRKWIKRAQSD